MKKSLIGIIIFVSMVGLHVWLNTQAALTGTTTATVTARSISLTVGDGTVAFGTLSLSATASTTIAGSGLADHQTATSTSNVVANLNIIGADSTSGYWTLAGSIGADTYTMDVCTTTCETAPHWKALNKAGYIDLKENVAVNNNVDNGTDFDLKIIVPSSVSTNGANEQSIVTTVQIE